MKEQKIEPKKTEVYSDQVINDLAEWADGLTIQQLLFLKNSYEALLQIHAHESGNTYVQ